MPRLQHVITGVSGVVRFVALRSLLAGASFLLSAWVHACEDWQAKTVSIQGSVEKRVADGQWQPLGDNGLLCPGDSLRVGRNSRAALYLNNNTYLRLDQLSAISFPRQRSSDSFWLELEEGVGHFISRIRNRFEITTPYVNAAVEGTEFLVAVAGNHGRVSVIEGAVKVRNGQGSLSLSAGEAAEAKANEAPSKHLVARPADEVQWALYYPPVIALTLLAPQGAPAVLQALRDAQTLMARDPQAALARLDQIAGVHPGLDLALARAAVLVASGQAEQARVALQASPQAEHSADTQALAAIVAVVQNQTQRARQLAAESVQKAPDKAAGYLALSYAEQSALQLEAALDAAKKAAAVEPENALAWARLAELQWILGDLDAAEGAVNEARTLDPGLGQAHSAAGFIDLLQLQFDEAEQAFAQARKAEPAAPEPYLGMALLNIRRGRLEEGRRQLEFAVNHDPTRSLLRTYLGKAYFEEKRDALARTQFDLAMQFDPNDPSPHFYEGVRLLFANQPIEALERMEVSREFNERRAIYRSDILLQSDAATRSAALARVYTDLGFDQRVLLEGWNSLQQDPTSHDGHRLLADRYSILPRHDAARVSELLQAQLWQPLSASALPPQRSETGLAVLETLGPSRPGFNEYHDLFIGNGIDLFANSIVGGNDTFGHDVVLSGLAGNVAGSLASYDYTTDGYRPNSDQDQTLYGAFLQSQIGASTSVQLEARKLDWERGDVGLDFFRDGSQTLRIERDVETYRFGLRHGWSATQHTLVSAIKQDVEEDQVDHPVPEIDFSLTSRSDESPWLVELQHMLQFEKTDWVLGVGRYRGPRQDRLDTRAVIDPALDPIVERVVDEDSTVKHNNAYLYSHWNATESVTALIGVSYDDFESPLVDVTQWNPKLGLWWRPIAGLNIRAAALRTLKRSMAANQTLEPTQVAGFNQIYDDENATEAWLYGLGADWQISDRGYAGLEISHRDLEVPFRQTITMENLKADWDESLYRAYFYHLIGSAWAFSSEYLFEDYNYTRDQPKRGQIVELDTQHLPVSFSYFHPSGFKSLIRFRYVWQEINELFTDPVAGESATRRGRDDFGLMDLILGYRFPQRYGEVSVGVANLTDRRFSYQDIDPLQPTLYPERFIYGRVTLSF